MGGEYLKKKTILLIISICLLFIVIISFIVYLDATDPWSKMYKDRTEYPLKLVDVNDSSNYMLVKWQHSPIEKYEVITDTQAIKANTSTFSVNNKGDIYGTTPDGMIWLFKDGKQIDTVPFDNTLTKNIAYGTIQFQQVNQLQYQLLVGCEIIEQGENYSILSDNRNEKTYYYSFVHGDDIENVNTVYLLNFTSDINEIAKPQKINEDIVEFIEHKTNYARNKTRHWYFRLSDCKLSNWYWNVRAIKDNLIVYASSYMNGGISRIIIHNMFDNSIDYKEIIGDFPEPRDDDFLLAAEFISDQKLKAEYIGKDGQVHNDVFSID
jgi:hypothetical protein